MIRRRISKANTKWCFHLDQCQISPKYSQLTHDHRSVWEREPLVIKWASMSVLVCPHMCLSCPRLSLSVPRCPCPVSVCPHLSPSVPVCAHQLHFFFLAYVRCLAEFGWSYLKEQLLPQTVIKTSLVWFTLCGHVTTTYWCQSNIKVVTAW